MDQASKIKLAWHERQGSNDRRSKQEKRHGDKLEGRRQQRLDEEAARELESAVQAKIVARQKKLVLETERMAQATKLMERECQSERVKVRLLRPLRVARSPGQAVRLQRLTHALKSISQTKRLEPELEKLATANSKLFRSISAARDSLSTLPTTHCPVSTLRPAEEEAIAIQNQKFEAGTSQLAELQASLAKTETERPSLEVELAKMNRGNGLVGINLNRLKTLLSEMRERKTRAEDRVRVAEAGAAAKAKLRDEMAAQAGKPSKEHLEEISVDVDSLTRQVATLKAQLEDGKVAPVELAKLRVDLVTVSEAVTERVQYHKFS